MDEDLDELIAQLCTRLGIIMEDVSAVAVGVTGLQGEEWRIAIDISGEDRRGVERDQRTIRLIRILP